MEVPGIAIAPRDLRPALGALVGQRGLVVHSVFPFDGDHIALTVSPASAIFALLSSC